MTLPTTRSVAIVAALSCLSAGHLVAQIPISGALSGTLAPAVYHATSNLSIAVGQTLTLGPGVIIKFQGQEFNVAGTLICNGTAGSRVIFTALADDSAGGDTNGNGPSVGSPTAWRGINFSSTASASSLTHADIRYGGSGFVSNLELTGCNATFRNCIVRDNYTHGMDLNGNSFPTVENCTFTDNGNLAIESVPIAALARFRNNTGTGNWGGTGNWVRVSVGNIDANLTLGPAQMMSGAIVLDAQVVLAAGVTWTCQAGTIFKLRNPHEIDIDGTLRCNGTLANPVVFTAFADDSAGGDTNGNGASSGGSTAWRGLVFGPTASGSALTRTDVRYGGSGFVSNLELNGCHATFTDCVVRDCYTHGMDLNGNSRPTVTRCAFTGNGHYAIESVAMAALPGFANNTASGNQGGAGNYARVTVGAVATDMTLGPAAMLGGAFVLDVTPDVAAGATLTLLPGAIFKFRNAHEFAVNGTLLSQGTAGSPVVFTALADDSAGGDTNGNGASSGGPTAWRGMVFSSTGSASVLDHTDLRYGGSGFVSNVELNASNPTLRHCVIRDCYTHGMDLNNSSLPTVTECTFTNNGNLAVENVSVQALPGFLNNTASGNGGNAGNFARVTSATVTAPLTLAPESMMSGAFVFDTTLSVAQGALLTVRQGSVFKFRNAHEVSVLGHIDLQGTGYEPVVFTALADDDHGGDTNGNGPSGGSPTAWRGLTIGATAGNSRLENVLIRYTGSGFVPGLTVASPLVALRSVRVDRAYDRGFLLSALAGNAANLVAWGCGGHGFHLTGGNFDLLHATSAGNGTGMRNEVWNGAVVNSIVWGNSTNFANFGAGAQVVRSNGGFAGSNGNVNVDPQFVSQASGDLHLQPTSPCLNTADLAIGVAVAKDHDENSRVLDHALTGAALPDLGAFELPAWTMTMNGVVRVGAVPTLTVTGPVGLSFWIWGNMDGVFPVNPYGVLLAGLPGPSIALLSPNPVPVGFVVPFVIPNAPNLVGATAGIQTLTFPLSGVATGNFTRLLRARVRA